MRLFFAWAISACLVSVGFSNSEFGLPIKDTSNSAGLGEGHIVSSSASVGGPFNGVSIGQNVGANRFYNAGYTGTRSIISSIEGGLAWSGHESLGHVNTFLFSNHPSMAGTRVGQFDRHATWVGHTLAGRGTNEYQRGIAYGSTLWTGGIATSYGTPAWSNSWGWSNGFAFTDPYQRSMLSGVSGQTADVINSSWGSSSTNTFNVFNFALDGMVRQSAKTLVFSAGNAGPTGNTVFWPANGHNMITVGALGSDLTGYDRISNFSSRGPSDYNGPDGTFAASRARIDITAPGQNMTLAFYGGLTGGNVGGTDPSGGANNAYTFNTQGTSFAAPTVSGGAALIVDAGKALFGGGESIDGRLVKSIIQTSADKPVGWNNGLTLTGGILTTTQSMDFAYGAGKLNLNNAYDLYVLGGTKNLAGYTGGNIQNTGWDVADVSEGGSTDFYISPSLLGNTTLTATLNWFANSSYSGTDAGGSILTNAGSFTNLGLEVWATDGTAPTSLIAESRAMFITNQHLNITIPNSGQYMLRVKWLGERYDFVGSNSERFALTWTSTAVPEPATIATITIGAMMLRRRRKIQK